MSQPEQVNGNVPSSLFHEERRRTEDRLDGLTTKVGKNGERVSKIEGKMDGFVTYKDIMLKFAPVIIGAVAAGAAIVIAASKWV